MGFARLLAGALVVLAAGCGRTGLLVPDGETAAPGDGGALVPDAGVTTDGASTGHDASGGLPDASAPGFDASSGRDAGRRDSGAGEDSGGARPDGGGTTPACGPATCAGCCMADGSCLLGWSDQACGLGGAECAACAPDWFCKGTCTQYQELCGPSNCAGCCQNASICSQGIDGNACGHGGEQCQTCRAGGANTCEPVAGGGGSCDFAGCDPSNCDGCCSGDVCLVGATDEACGAGGVACAACNGGTTCTRDPNGAFGCAAVTPCDPSTCGGCCDGLVCALGDQDVACGTGGVACAACASGQSCGAGACR
ncbi:MAG TPA: hypothetical protein VIY73_08410 [Polyangiaceae bacterium]